jgi:chitin disaccharide deacetylase
MGIEPDNRSAGPLVSERVLIVNADDLGRSPGVNRGVIRAHEEGVVTSSSLMVRWPAAEDAAAYARDSALSVGLHLDVGEWVYRGGDWHASYRVLADETAEEAAAEIANQLERFERLIGRPTTHLDSHQHVHRTEPVLTALLRAGERLRVPVRDLTPGIAYSGAFYGQDGEGAPLPEAITVEGLVRTITELPPGITELGCHPATDVDHEAVYARERVQELETLCDPEVRAAIERCAVALRSFADLPSLS